MRIHGGCDCNNIEIFWYIYGQTLVPRACQCEYCSSRSAAYVSRPDTGFEATIHSSESHRPIQHGSNSAIFHECSTCEQVVFVTAEVDGELYGALNANQFNDQSVVTAPVKLNFSSQSGEEKRAALATKLVPPSAYKALFKRQTLSSLWNT